MRGSVPLRPIRRVSVYTPSASERRGTERLLRDCALVGRMVDLERPPAWHRLEVELGDRLAGQLVAAMRTRLNRDNGST